MRFRIAYGCGKTVGDTKVELPGVTESEISALMQQGASEGPAALLGKLARLIEQAAATTEPL